MTAPPRGVMRSQSPWPPDGIAVAVIEHVEVAVARSAVRLRRPRSTAASTASAACTTSSPTSSSSAAAVLAVGEHRGAQAAALHLALVQRQFAVAGDEGAGEVVPAADGVDPDRRAVHLRQMVPDPLVAVVPTAASRCCRRRAAATGRPAASAARRSSGSWRRRPHRHRTR